MPFERGVNCCVDIGVESPPNLGLDTWRCLDANPDVSQRYSVARPVASRPVGLRGRGHNRIPPTCWNPVRTSTVSAIAARRCSLLIWCFIPSQSHPRSSNRNLHIDLGTTFHHRSDDRSDCARPTDSPNRQRALGENAPAAGRYFGRGGTAWVDQVRGRMTAWISRCRESG